MSAPFPHDFALDRFQRDAADAVTAGRNVLVSAPTGSGKTVVGEIAVAAALRSAGRAFYTAPIKALSNQKYNDLRDVLGPGEVGLLTGDHSINGDAPVVVMTTEVLRNMVYSRADALEGLRWVVLDEVHFLQDAYRGPVWEEVLIHTPASVRFACLSATVSNAPQLGAWIESLRGPTTTVLEHRRPVELDALYLVGDRRSEVDHLLPLLVDGRPNADGERFDAHDQGPARPRRGGHPPRRRFRTPRRVEVVERLAEEDLLPAITFVFSRAGCEEAAARCLDDGLRLTTAEEVNDIRAIVESHTEGLAAADLDVLGYDRFAETLSRGIAAHHAGMVPAFREAVEQCFVRGLIKVVFATETLALGINMPARSVVIERLTKFTGEGHEMLTPGQFTQLTGRAGRRGIDERGAAIVLWSPFVSFARTAELAASREFPLGSVFRPTYNMAVNLVARHDPTQARAVLGRSFAQFQTDAAVVSERTRRDQRALDVTAAEHELAEVGVSPDDATAYLALVTEEQRRRRHGDAARTAVQRSLAALQPGDVLERTTPKGPRLLVVVATSQRKRSTRVEALTARGNTVRIEDSTLEEPVEPCGSIQLPVPFAPKDAAFRAEAAARLRRVNRKRLRRARPRATDGQDDAALDVWLAARDAAEAHPLHTHARREEILAAARRMRSAARDVATAQGRIERRGTDLVARFDAVLRVLADNDHLEGWELTAAGRRLRRIYHESDLLLSLAIGADLFEDLDAPSLAALLSCITHEHRGAERPPPPRLPTRDLQDRFERLAGLAVRLGSQERAAGLAVTREPSAGFARAAHRWCGGRPLEESLEEDMSGGDFVRNAKQLIDVLKQVAEVTRTSTSHTSSLAAELLGRDVVEAGTGPR